MMIAAAALVCSLCLYGPDNMAFDSTGALYIADTDGAHRSRILRLSPDGKVLWSWERFAYVKGARNGPEGIALDRSGTIFVTDGGASNVLEIAPDGKLARPLGDGTVRFEDLGHVAIDGFGNIYVSEAGPNLILKFNAAGALIAQWRRAKGNGADAWSGPETIAVQPSGNVVVEDWANRRIVILSPNGTTVASFGKAGRDHGQFLNSSGLAVDLQGNIYVADATLHRVQKFDPKGTFIDVVADERAFKAGGPTAVAIDAGGTLYSPDGKSIVKYTQNGDVLARWQ
jgi:tripartite motif-containing protein 71